MFSLAMRPYQSNVIQLSKQWMCCGAIKMPSPALLHWLYPFAQFTYQILATDIFRLKAFRCDEMTMFQLSTTLLICGESAVAVNLCLATGGQRHQVHAARRRLEEQQQRGRSEHPGGDHANLLQNLPQRRHLAVHQGTPLEETR